MYQSCVAIQDTIIKASLDNLEPLNPEEYGLKKTNAPYPPEKCPILFQWKTFHESVKKWNNDTKVDTIDHLPKTVTPLLLIHLFCFVVIIIIITTTIILYYYIYY